MSGNEYNKFSKLRILGYKIIEHLMLNNEEIWKLLKYPKADALSQPNLTLAEKRELIYNGQEEQDEYRVFRQPFIGDGFSDEVTQLRVYSWQVDPTVRTWGTVDMAIEVLCHNKLVSLNTYESRLEVMVQDVIETLNGSDINGLSPLFFDNDGRANNSARLNIYNNKDFLGFTIVMSTRM